MASGFWQGLSQMHRGSSHLRVLRASVRNFERVPAERVLLEKALNDLVRACSTVIASWNAVRGSSQPDLPD
jgi:hypothetical protein